MDKVTYTSTKRHITNHVQHSWDVLYTTLWTSNHLSSVPHSLTHWGWVTHICVSELPIIASDNGLLPGGCHAIIWTNAWILGTNFSEIISEIHTLSFKKMHLKMSSGNQWPFCLSFNVFTAVSHTRCQVIYILLCTGSVYNWISTGWWFTMFQVTLHAFSMRGDL